MIARDAPDAAAAATLASALGCGKGPIAITAAMIERELARERRHKNKEYGMNCVQLSMQDRGAQVGGGEGEGAG
jgi:hypothetical protein